MCTPTDIPDWVFVECFGNYDWKQFGPPTKDEIAIMYDLSPVSRSVSRIKQVKTPTLVGLGLADLRVPPSQGLEWYYTLRSNGIPTKLLTYPDEDHAIAGVGAEADHWINIKRFFDEHLKGATK
jgi:acylaminoacyl-peptidase